MMMRTLSGLISRQHKAVVFLDESYTVIYKNRFAYSLLQKTEGISIEEGKLVNSCSEQNNKLLISLIRSKNERVSSTIFWKSLKSSDPVRIDILPILEEFAAAENSKPIMMVLMDTPGINKSLIKGQFLEFYHLTAAEVAIVELLVRGLSLNQCAHKRKITISTARWTLGNIFSKTKTNSQKELISVARLFSD